MSPAFFETSIMAFPSFACDKFVQVSSRETCYTDHPIPEGATPSSKGIFSEKPTVTLLPSTMTGTVRRPSEQESISSSFSGLFWTLMKTALSP
jgi:hypothetical protein